MFTLSRNTNQAAEVILDFSELVGKSLDFYGLQTATGTPADCRCTGSLETEAFQLDGAVWEVLADYTKINYDETWSRMRGPFRVTGKGYQFPTRPLARVRVEALNHLMRYPGWPNEDQPILTYARYLKERERGEDEASELSEAEAQLYHSEENAYRDWLYGYRLVDVSDGHVWLIFGTWADGFFCVYTVRPN